MDYEYCCECEEPTGRAGRHDDSIYIGGPDGEIGPLCEECYSKYTVCDNCGEVITDTKGAYHDVEDEIWECAECRAEANHQNEEYRRTQGRMK